MKIQNNYALVYAYVYWPSEVHLGGFALNYPVCGLIKLGRE